MKKLASWSKWAGVGALAVVAIAGCTPKQDEAVDEATNTVVPAADNAMGAIGNQVEGAADFATITPNVKEALGDNKALVGSNIDVDTDVENKVVHLKGSVKDEAQKKLAEETAKQELVKMKPASPFTVQNELVVGAMMPGAPGAPAPKM